MALEDEFSTLDEDRHNHPCQREPGKQCVDGAKHLSKGGAIVPPIEGADDNDSADCLKDNNDGGERDEPTEPATRGGDWILGRSLQN